MAGVEKGRKLPFQISDKLWPTEWSRIWEESSVVSNWSANHRGNVKQALGRFLAYAAYADLPANPTKTAIEGYVKILDEHISGTSVVSYMDLLAYGLLALNPDCDWLWLQQSNRALRAQKISKPASERAKAREKKILRLPLEQWSEDERARWAAAFQGPEELKPKRYLRRHERNEQKDTQSNTKAYSWRKPPHQWSPAFRSRVERGWGMLRQWCITNYEEATTPEAFSSFIGDCAARKLSPVSIASYAFEAYRAGTIMYPEMDWSWQRACCTELDENAEPTKDKLQKYVPPDQLFSFAIDLMNGASNGLPTARTAIQFRDGLFLALLCTTPKRVGNLGSIFIGENLLLDSDGIPENLYFPTTKNGDASTSPFPSELIPFFQEWMKRFRPALLKSETDVGAMWIGRDGKPLGTNAFWTQLTKRTKKKFGKAIGPHMLRSCYATFFAEKSPEFMPLVQKALDHRDQRSIEHYQLMAGSFAAGRKLDQMLDLIRKPSPALPQNY